MITNNQIDGDFMVDNRRDTKLKGPNNKDLPFFTYGIFKPGQIAYSKIKDYIAEKNETEINYPMKHRDGVPILLPKDMERPQTMGYILYFNDNNKAYDIINQTLSNQLYKWNTITIEDEEVNVLFGKRHGKGSNPIESMSDRRNYDGKNDPLFKEGIELIRENLESEHFSWEKGFFRLQMNYMLLWSAIDRYCKIRYNKDKEKENREALAEEEFFKEALIKYSSKRPRSVFNTENLYENKFNIEKPSKCLNYYYTLRCNIVHRGKTSMRDIDMLEEATNELINIFEYVLNKTFKDDKE